MTSLAAKDLSLLTAAPRLSAAAISSHSLNEGEAVMQKSSTGQHDDDVDVDMTRAIVAISMGTEATESSIVERFVWSAVNRGQWKGPIVLITDAPQGRYDKLTTWTDNFVEVHPPQHHYSQKHVAIEMVRKRFKTFILDYMSIDSTTRLSKVQTVYYLDIDIVFASPLRPMMHKIETRYMIGSMGNGKSDNYTASIPRMWMFQGNTARWSIQGGQMILDRATSQPCLRRWRDLFDQHLMARKDQISLNIMVKEQERDSSQEGGKCEIIPMDQDGFIVFPERRDVAEIVNGREHGGGPTTKHNRTYAPLVHIRNTSSMRNLNEKNWQLFLQDILGLHDGEGDPHGITAKILF